MNQSTLEKSTNALNRIIDKLQRNLGIHVVIQKDKKGEFITKIDVQSKNAQIKIEPSFVFRGTVYPTVESETRPKVNEILERMVKMQILSFEDLFAGKLCAALNRQHPRDIFDMKLLLDNEGLTDKTRKAFVVYLASDSRPIDELLDPNLQDLSAGFNSEFKGMTNIDIKAEELINIRDYLCKNIAKMLSEEEKQFLISLVQMEPKWSLLSLPVDVKALPGIKFKLMNLEKMEKNKRDRYLNKLKSLLSY